MHELYELKEKLMKELTEYSQNGKFSKEDAENIKYISSAIDHICNIVERMEDEDGYSQRGGGGSYAGGGGGNRRSYAGGSNRGTGGGSYAGNSYEGGGGGRSYARGRNARRDSMGRYSREGGYSEEYSGGEDIEEMVESIKGMMQELPQEVQMDAKRFVQKLEQSMM